MNGLQRRYKSGGSLSYDVQFGAQRDEGAFMRMAMSFPDLVAEANHRRKDQQMRTAKMRRQRLAEALGEHSELMKHKAYDQPSFVQRAIESIRNLKDRMLGRAK